MQTQYCKTAITCELGGEFVLVRPKHPGSFQPFVVVCHLVGWLVCSFVLEIMITMLVAASCVGKLNNGLSMLEQNHCLVRRHHTSIGLKWAKLNVCMAGFKFGLPSRAFIISFSRFQSVSGKSW